MSENPHAIGGRLIHMTEWKILRALSNGKRPLKTVSKKPNNKVKIFVTYSINKGWISLIYNKLLKQRKSPKLDGKMSKRFGKFTQTQNILQIGFKAKSLNNAQNKRNKYLNYF